MTKTTEYDHRKIEKRWQKIWEESGLYKTPKTNIKNKKYVLDMFPYPSGATLHVGHLEGYIGTDILSRFLRMGGNSVLHPMGWDAFGLPTENYAIKTGIEPYESTKKNVTTFKRQLVASALSYDWDYEINTSDPNFYKWTQWLFILMFENNLAYKKKSPVNWCPSCETVLANEQVENDRCERCQTEVVQKELEQWFLKITDYADRLISDIEGIDWPADIKIQQRNWIGKKEGITISYQIKDPNSKTKDKTYINCWTSRPDTNFGATFIVVSPEFAKENLLKKLSSKEKVKVSKYIKESLSKTEIQRRGDGKKKTGVFTGLYAVNQLNGYEMPIWVSDFVLAEVGTGAVVGVPGHDRRDFEFAKEFNLPVKIVVKKKDPEFFRSYLMGANEITDSELQKLKIRIAEKTKSGSRKLEIPRKAYAKYQNLVKEKLSGGYWNEVVGEEIWFLFKNKEGKVKEFVLNEGNSNDIAKLCSEYNNDPLKKTSNLICYLAENDWYTDYLIQEGDGVMVNSEFLDGMDIHKATKKMMNYIQKKGWGKIDTNYHLRDWLISRQRYWGCPIPMIHCKSCGWQTVPESDLPVVLPKDVDFRPKGTSPIARSVQFQKGVKCPVCGKSAKREVDTMDTYVDSSWYFIRFVDPKNQKRFADPEKIKQWLPVDIYVGGGHVVQHLLFARFIWKVLLDAGLLPKNVGNEPFLKLRAPGWILGPDSRKMSKRWGNVITPDDIIPKFGADVLRVYEMFMGPFDAMKPWSMTGVEGANRFLNKVWTLVNKHKNLVVVEEKDASGISIKMHQTINKVTKDIEEFRFNTAIASLMEFTNLLIDVGRRSADFETSAKTDIHTQKSASVRCAEWDQALKTLVLLLAPFAPYMMEELWQSLSNLQINTDSGTDSRGLAKSDINLRKSAKWSVHLQPWPKYNPELIKEEVLTIAVQVNGKLRGTITVNSQMSKIRSEVVQMAKDAEKVSRWLAGKTVKKEIFVPGKLVNFVL